jgi:hypothetical protein
MIAREPAVGLHLPAVVSIGERSRSARQTASPAPGLQRG